MPQLDVVSYFSQFFWLCFFFLGFYFSLVQFFLPKMARILKLRTEKMTKIQSQSSSYLAQAKDEQGKRWSSYATCLKIQKKLAEAVISRNIECNEESWENSLGFKSQANFDEAFSYENKTFNKHMINQNAPVTFLFLINKENPVNAMSTTNQFFL